MPTVTPCPTPYRRRSTTPRSTTSARLARHFGDVYEAPTYLRIDGVWRSVKTPSQDLIATADLMLQGGHATDISSTVYSEIIDAGLCLTYVDPAGTSSSYPSTTATWPSTTGTFPYDDDTETPPTDDGLLLPSATTLPSSTTLPEGA